MMRRTEKLIVGGNGGCTPAKDIASAGGGTNRRRIWGLFRGMGNRPRIKAQFGQTICRPFGHDHFQGVPLSFSASLLRIGTLANVRGYGTVVAKTWRGNGKIVLKEMEEWKMNWVGIIKIDWATTKSLANFEKQKEGRRMSPLGSFDWI